MINVDRGLVAMVCTGALACGSNATLPRETVSAVPSVSDTTPTTAAPSVPPPTQTTPLAGMSAAPASPPAAGMSQPLDAGMPPAVVPLDATIPMDDDAGTAPTDISVWLAGDSTVANGVSPCPIGWGAELARYFNDHVKVENRAVGGTSVTNWMYEVLDTMDERGECALARSADGQPQKKPRWQRMLDGMKAGDYLLVQFGINDGNRTCPYHAGLTAFGETYGVFARAAKERGVHPIFVTPVSAVKCRQGSPQATRGVYVTATVDAGKTFDVPVIDLHQLSIDLFAERSFCPMLGDGQYVTKGTTGAVGAFFCDDNTHFARDGAIGMAQLVADALHDQHLDLADYLKPAVSP